MKYKEFWGKCYIAGIQYEGRQQVVASLEHGEQVMLKREPNNPHDSHAIALTTQKGRSIGYIPRAEAKRIAPLIDQGVRFIAYVDLYPAGKREETNVPLHIFTENEGPLKLTADAKWILTELRKVEELYGACSFGIFLQHNKEYSLLKIRPLTLDREKEAVASSMLEFDFPRNRYQQIHAPLEELQRKQILEFGVNMHFHIELKKFGREINLSEIEILN